jgi:integrase
MTAMPRPRPPHLHRETNRHGKTVWYVCVGKGPRIRIKAVHGAPEFEEAYQVALRGNQPHGPAKAARGTLGWLFQLYRQTTAWTDLAPSTPYKREKIMMRVLATAEHQPVSAINETAVIAGRERRAATPASAQAFIDTLHGLFKWAVSMKLAASDPTMNVKVRTKSKRKGGYPPWTDEDMTKFEARCPRGTRERVIFDILAYTGLRTGDVATLGRQHLKQRTIVIDGQPVRRTVISIDSEKTGMRVELPLLSQLQATLDTGPTGDLAFVVTRRGTPWTKGALGTEFVAAAKAAGGREISLWHAQGRRNTGRRERGDRAGAGGYLRLVRGRMARLYTKSANRSRLAAGAIGKLDRGETENRTSIPAPLAEVRAGNRKTK